MFSPRHLGPWKDGAPVLVAVPHQSLLDGLTDGQGEPRHVVRADHAVIDTRPKEVVGGRIERHPARGVIFKADDEIDDVRGCRWTGISEW
jgi:hypothetical protein